MKALPSRPTTQEQRQHWQDIVDAAYALSMLDSAREYGLVDGGPSVDLKRCDEVLRIGLDYGIAHSSDAIERYIIEHNELCFGKKHQS